MDGWMIPHMINHVSRQGSVPIADIQEHSLCFYINIATVWIIKPPPKKNK